MRFIVSGAAALGLAIALLAACNSNDSQPKKQTVSTTNPNAQQQQQQHTDGVRRITATELKAAWDKGEVFVVDVRPPEAYAMEHLKGSINMTEAEFEARYKELPTDKLIVTYCS